jgi:Derlin-2/3
MVYLNFKAAEQNAIILRAYAQFIMMIVYLLIFINIINILAFKIFGFKIGFTLAQQLFLSFIYIDSKRQPQKIVTLYFFRMKNAFFPYALIVLNIVSGGGIYDNIIGIIAGNIYYVLKDVLPVSKNLNILKTPKFLVDAVEKYYYSRLPQEDPNNNNGNDNNNGQFGFGNSGVMNRGNNNNNNTNRPGFRAFGGRGYTVG